MLEEVPFVTAVQNLCARLRNVRKHEIGMMLEGINRSRMVLRCLLARERLRVTQRNVT